MSEIDSRLLSNEDNVETTKPPTPVTRFIDFSFDVLQQIALGAAFFVIFYMFIISPNQVKGSSMYPTFHDKEYILTDKISFKLRDIHRGEVIILQSPDNPDVDFIKRVVALPGERVMIRDGKVYVNDTQLDEQYINVETPTFINGFMLEGEEKTVPEGNYFVLGDNRPGSADSREYGFIPRDHVIGRVLYRYFPLSRAGMINDPHYSLTQ